MPTTRRVRPEVQADLDAFRATFGEDARCYCNALGRMAPCSVCAHPGHPAVLESDDAYVTLDTSDFEAEIDAAPRGDPDVRFAYADWLEEQGDAAGARFQRWMGEWKASAAKSDNDKYLWLYARGLQSSAPDSISYQGLMDMFPTRIAAELALRAALEQVDYEVTW